MSVLALTLARIKCLRLSNVRYIETWLRNRNILITILGLENNDADKYIKKYKLQNVNSDRLLDTLKFFSATYNKNDILQHLNFLQNCNVITWEERHMYLNECGFQKITLQDLLNFRRLNYRTVFELKNECFIGAEVVVPLKLLGYLRPLPDGIVIDDLLDEDKRLTDIARAIKNRYLMLRLDATEENLKTVMRIHHRIYNKSFKSMSENINFALDIGFTKDKIIRNAYIIGSNWRRTKELMETIPNFLGDDLRRHMRTVPKLFGISLQHIYNIYNMLKEEQIPDETIRNSMPIFTLSESVVKQRLDDIKSTPETRVLIDHPRILEVIVHHSRSKHRLKFLKKLKLKCAPLRIIGIDNENNFECHIKEGKDTNRLTEMEIFLRNLLNLDGDEILKELKKHPFYLNIPLTSMEDTYLFLISKGFSNQHVVNAVHILLYPREKINAVINYIKSDESLRSKTKGISRIQYLNLIMYFIEKDHHFTGNGVWPEVISEELQ